jgi:SAM-dependent methyltransferase
MKRPYSPDQQQRQFKIDIEKDISGETEIKFYSWRNIKRVLSIFAPYGDNKRTRIKNGYLYFRATKEVDRKTEEYDLGPFKLKVVQASSLSAKIELPLLNTEGEFTGDTDFFGVFTRDAEEAMRRLVIKSKQNSYKIESFVLRQTEVVEAVEEMPTDQENVEDKKQANQTEEKPKKSVFEAVKKPEATLAQRILDSLKITESMYLSLQDKSKTMNKTQSLYEINKRIINIIDSKGQEKALYRSYLRSGRFQFFANYLRFQLLLLNKRLAGEVSLTDFYDLSIDKKPSEIKMLIRQLSSILPPEDKSIDRFVTPESRLKTKSTTRSSQDYDFILFKDLLLEGVDMKSYFESCHCVLDAGSGQTFANDSNFLNEVKKINPNCRTIGVDMHYDESNSELISSTGGRVKRGDLIKLGREQGHELYGDPIQYLKHIGDEVVDVYTSSWVYDKFSEDHDGTVQALREAIRVVKPGGEIRISPMHYTKKVADFLNQYSDALYVKVLENDSILGYDWNKQIPTVKVVFQRLKADPERLEQIKKESMEWLSK